MPKCILVQNFKAELINNGTNINRNIFNVALKKNWGGVFLRSPYKGCSWLVEGTVVMEALFIDCSVLGLVLKQ